MKKYEIFYKNKETNTKGSLGGATMEELKELDKAGLLNQKTDEIIEYLPNDKYRVVTKAIFKELKGRRNG